MENTHIFDNNDGLVQTTVHGFKQDAFLVTQDKVESFNNYSSELQIWIALFSISAGSFLSSITTWGSIQSNNDLVKIICWISLTITILSVIFLYRAHRKFISVRKGLFIKVEQNGDSLKIVHAEYGTEEVFFDITDILNQEIKNNKIKIQITNKIAGDPIERTPKRAKIRYVFNNEIKDVSIKENDYLELP